MLHDVFLLCYLSLFPFSFTPSPFSTDSLFLLLGEKINGLLLAIHLGLSNYRGLGLHKGFVFVARYLFIPRRRAKL